MENKLKQLFEYQKFEQNPELNKVIRETEMRYPEELSEDELEMVAAAGIPGVATGKENKPDSTKPFI
ncbi:MAG: hypothetical protein IKR47_05505 [Lachnospiraceae bacterium]|jgi:hypothetical protein|nr:hypothetical protein [Lachnospiraceae bacterium]MCR4684508.1 hypothetical protein [Lachnospiraceae bacterium]